MQSFYNPPFFIVVAGLIIAFLSGKAFEATLKQRVNEWAQARSSRIIIQMQGLQLQLPFLGIWGGSCIFLGSGLSIFGLPPGLTYCVSVPLTTFMAALIWAQLGKLLQQLQAGGSEVLKIY